MRPPRPLSTTMVRRLIRRLDTLLEGTERVKPLAVDFSRCRVARWKRGRGGEGYLVPVLHPHTPDPSWLVALDDIISLLHRNTSSFLAGAPCHDILLWGDRGCGKSTLVKSLLHTFDGTPLRMIEVGRGDLQYLNDIDGIVRDSGYRFILYCDDLSFGPAEEGYRELKRVLDGGVDERSGNIVIYATSNRRHLLPEYWSENSGDVEIHANEAVAEKLALSDRFGLSIQVPSHGQDHYLAMVRSHLMLLGIDPDSFDYRTPALQWARLKGNQSGRTARQFAIDHAGGISDPCRRG